MTILIALSILLIVYLTFRYTEVKCRKSMLPWYYRHGELVNEYVHFLCVSNAEECIVAAIDCNDTNITVRYANGFRPYCIGDILKITKFKNGIYYVAPQTYIEVCRLMIYEINEDNKPLIESIFHNNIKFDIDECIETLKGKVFHARECNEFYVIEDVKNNSRTQQCIQNFNAIPGCTCELLYYHPIKYIIDINH